ncbi:S-adenosyl-L-methionine-dependent methyltransferase [Xylariaceae sp. FL0255]|nr:S-adenosyl-L-methionine-dependent methyltransferase [Xylariaceae sp. FL0255]
MLSTSAGLLTRTQLLLRAHGVMASLEQLIKEHDTDTAKVYHLSPREELVFASLFHQAHDAASPAPILGDPYAQQHISKIACDFSQSQFFTDPAMIKAFMGRFKLHDRWVQNFINAHEAAGQPVTVLSLRCALDSRCLRINRGSSVRWIDVDSPEIVNLRRKLMQTLPPGDYNLIEADFAEEGWLERIPADRPTYIIAEEMLMWMKPQDGEHLVQRLISHFPKGQFGTDVVGPLIQKLSFLLPILKDARAPLRWAVNDERKIEQLHHHLRLRQAVKWYELVGAKSKRDFPNKGLNRLRRYKSNGALSETTGYSNNGTSTSPTSSHSSGGSTERPDIFGRFTSLFSYIPGFKNCAQVVLFDFGPSLSKGDSTHSTLDDLSGINDGSSRNTGASFIDSRARSVKE